MLEQQKLLEHAEGFSMLLCAGRDTTKTSACSRGIMFVGTNNSS